MEYNISSEDAIRSLVRSNIKTFAQTFSERHISEFDNPDGTLNMKIHNVFIAVLGKELQYYTALVRSFDSSLGNMLENLAVSISEFFYDVRKSVTGVIDKETNEHFLIELKIGGDLDNKKARSEKEALFEQYAILSNTLDKDAKIKCFFATAYNRYGEGNPWRQGRVRQFFSDEELLIGKDFWNFICKSENGYDIVIDEYTKNASIIKDALEHIKLTYLS